MVCFLKFPFVFLDYLFYIHNTTLRSHVNLSLMTGWCSKLGLLGASQRFARTRNGGSSVWGEVPGGGNKKIQME